MDQEHSANQPASQPVGIFAVAAAVNNMLDDWLTAQFGMSGGVSTDCPATGYTVTPTPDRVNGIKHLNYLIRTEKYISQQSLTGIQCIPPQGQSCNTKIMTISTSVQNQTVFVCRTVLGKTEKNGTLVKVQTNFAYTSDKSCTINQYSSCYCTSLLIII